MLFFVECISTFVSECFHVDSIVDDMDRNFLRCCFLQSTVCILYSLQSKVIRTGSDRDHNFQLPPSQSATVLVASLLLYAVFFDINRFSSMQQAQQQYVFLIVSFLFLRMFQCLFYLFYHCCVTALKTKVMICMYFCYMLFNKYSIH